MTELLRTERLRVRQWIVEDAEDAYAIFSDSEVTRFMVAGPVASLEQQRENLRRTVARYAEGSGYGAWAVERLDDGRLVGNIGLRPLPGWPEVEVGWHLARRWWGNGYATEAARGVLRYGFLTLGLQRIVAVIRPENVRSVAVATRLGMMPEGPIRAFDRDMALFGIERATFVAGDPMLSS